MIYHVFVGKKKKAQEEKKYFLSKRTIILTIELNILESAPNSPRIGSPLNPKKNTDTSNLQAMSRGLSTSLPDLDSEHWIEVKKRHHPSSVKLRVSCCKLSEEWYLLVGV